jgi:hypothetical protein
MNHDDGNDHYYNENQRDLNKIDLKGAKLVKINKTQEVVSAAGRVFSIATTLTILLLSIFAYTDIHSKAGGGLSFITTAYASPGSELQAEADHLQYCKSKMLYLGNKSMELGERMNKTRHAVLDLHTMDKQTGLSLVNQSLGVLDALKTEFMTVGMKCMDVAVELNEDPVIVRMIGRVNNMTNSLKNMTESQSTSMAVTDSNNTNNADIELYNKYLDDSSKNGNKSYSNSFNKYLDNP